MAVVEGNPPAAGTCIVVAVVIDGLVVDNGQTRRFELRAAGDKVRIGRAKDNDIVVPQKGASSYHAELVLVLPDGEASKPQLVLKEKSTNGTGLKAPGLSTARLEKDKEMSLPDGSLVIVPSKIKASDVQEGVPSRAQLRVQWSQSSAEDRGQLPELQETSADNDNDNDNDNNKNNNKNTNAKEGTEVTEGAEGAVSVAEVAKETGAIAKPKAPQSVAVIATETGAISKPKPPPGPSSVAEIAKETGAMAKPRPPDGPSAVAEIALETGAIAKPKAQAPPPKSEADSKDGGAAISGGAPPKAEGETQPQEQTSPGLSQVAAEALMKAQAGDPAAAMAGLGLAGQLQPEAMQKGMLEMWAAMAKNGFMHPLMSPFGMSSGAAFPWSGVQGVQDATAAPKPKADLTPAALNALAKPKPSWPSAALARERLAQEDGRNQLVSAAVSKKSFAAKPPGIGGATAVAATAASTSATTPTANDAATAAAATAGMMPGMMGLPGLSGLMPGMQLSGLASMMMMPQLFAQAQPPPPKATVSDKGGYKGFGKGFGKGGKGPVQETSVTIAVKEALGKERHEKVIELAATFQLEAKQRLQLAEQLSKRLDSFDDDLAAITRILEGARSPPGLLAVKLREMREGTFSNRDPRDYPRRSGPAPAPAPAPDKTAAPAPEEAQTRSSPPRAALSATNSVPLGSRREGEEGSRDQDNGPDVATPSRMRGGRRGEQYSRGGDDRHRRREGRWEFNSGSPHRRRRGGRSQERYQRRPSRKRSRRRSRSKHRSRSARRPRDARDARDGRDARDARDARDTRDTRDMRDTRDARAAARAKSQSRKRSRSRSKRSRSRRSRSAKRAREADAPGEARQGSAAEAKEEAAPKDDMAATVTEAEKAKTDEADLARAEQQADAAIAQAGIEKPEGADAGKEDIEKEGIDINKPEGADLVKDAVAAAETSQAADIVETMEVEDAGRPNAEAEVAAEGREPEVAAEGREPDVAAEGKEPEVAAEGRKPEVATGGRETVVAGEGRETEVTAVPPCEEDSVQDGADVESKGKGLADAAGDAAQGAEQ